MIVLPLLPQQSHKPYGSLTEYMLLCPFSFQKGCIDIVMILCWSCATENAEHLFFEDPMS